MKPIQRRSPGQKTAHLILSLTDADTANRAIANGLVICNRRTRIEKVKKEPVRCLKCHGWNHFAYECISTQDTCGNCAEKHRTSECHQPELKRCVSCNVEGHASWSRECPVFLRKVDECNYHNPENLLPFIPAAEPWTWTARPEEQQRHKRTDAHQLRLHHYDNPQGHRVTDNEPNLCRDQDVYPTHTWDQEEPHDWSLLTPKAPEAMPLVPTTHTSNTNA